MTSGVESNASSNTESTGGDMRIRGELEQTIRRLLTAVDRTGVSPQKVSIYLTDNDTTDSFVLRPRLALANISRNLSKSQCFSKHAKSWISLASRWGSVFFQIIFMVEMTALTSLAKSCLILHSCHKLGTASCSSFLVILVSLANKNSWSGSIKSGRKEVM